MTTINFFKTKEEVLLQSPKFEWGEWRVWLDVEVNAEIGHDHIDTPVGTYKVQGIEDIELTLTTREGRNITLEVQKRFPGTYTYLRCQYLEEANERARFNTHGEESDGCW